MDIRDILTNLVSHDFGPFKPIPVIIAAFIAGLMLKLIDDAFDEGAYSKRLAMGVCLADCAIAVSLMLDRDGFITIGAIFWSSLFRGKVDNYAFYFGYIVTGTAWISLFMLIRPFELGWLVLVGLSVNIGSLFVTTRVHDIFEKRRNPVMVFLIKHRFMHLSMVSLLLLFGGISLLGMAMLGLFIIGYSTGGWVTAAVTARVKEKTIKAIDVIGDEKDVQLAIRVTGSNRPVD